MYPNIEINFLHEERRYEDLIRQIQLENEVRRAYSDARRAKGRRPHNLGSSLALIATGLSSIVRIFNRPTAEAGQPDPCPDPCLAA
jgi:hypothetical protein